MSEHPLPLYTLRLADTGLVNGHRLSEWCGHAPVLEEELALANIALDLIGQARAFCLCGTKSKARDETRTHSPICATSPPTATLLIVERPNGDFALTIMRQFLISAFMHPFWEAMRAHRRELAAIAAKAVKEIAYHLRHCGEWTIRLGDGTPKAIAAWTKRWTSMALTGELFETDEVESGLIAAGSRSTRRRYGPSFDTTSTGSSARRPCRGRATAGCRAGGRHGRHSEHLGHVLAELQYLQRAYPGATW